MYDHGLVKIEMIRNYGHVDDRISDILRPGQKFSIQFNISGYKFGCDQARIELGNENIVITAVNRQ